MESTIELSGGAKIPQLGFGTYLLNDEDAETAVFHALAAGYRHIDTAEFYANHVGIAAGIAKSGVSRSDIFITDKLAPNDGEWTKFKNYDKSIAACGECLSKLQTDYIDLYLVHHAFAKDERVNQYRACVDLQKKGSVRSIGVSNWSEKHIEEILAAGLPLPSMNQIEIHPLCSQEPLIAYCKAKGIAITAYSSLAPHSAWRTDPGQGSAKEQGEQFSAYEAAMRPIMASTGATEAQILLKWPLQRGYVIIPKSKGEARIKENANLFNFDLTSEQMDALNGLDINKPMAWPTGNPLLAE